MAVSRIPWYEDIFEDDEEDETFSARANGLLPPRHLEHVFPLLSQESLGFI